MAEVVIIKQLDNSESMSYYNRKKCSLLKHVVTRTESTG